MKIYVAEESGFCFGVKRAVESSINASKNKESLPVYTLGPIIHNPQVVNKLKELGVKVIESINDISEGTVIIRSHGVPPDVINKARKKGLKILDATCPYVKNAQKYARKLVKDGYQTIIYGDHDHPEVIGICGAAEGKAEVISNKNKLSNIKLKNKVGFVAQTTKSPEFFKEIVSNIVTRVKELKVYNTICNTTEIRQDDARKLANKVDLMFVIGGYNSANTRRLAEICALSDTPTYHIETAADIDKRWLKNKFKVGITAGASTPEWLIKEVIEAMSEEKKDFQVEDEVTEETKKEEKVLNGEENEENKSPETNEKGEEKTNNQEEEEREEENTDNELDVEENVETDEELKDNDEKEEEIDYSKNDIADLKKGQIVTGKVSQIKEDGIYVDVNYKTDGFIPLRELSHKNIDDPNDIVDVEEEISVVILTLEDDEGNMILSKKRADYEKAWEKIMDVYDNDEIIEAEVTKVVKGGLVVDIGLRGFIPASHVGIGYVEDLDKYIGEKIKLKVIEIERDKNNVVLSAKKVLEAKRKVEKEETLNSLEEGQSVKGVITKLVDFGAFVDLGGIEGLLHISEMSWGRIGHPSEVFEEGQEIEVKILGVNKDDERISLGYKQLLPDPWEEFVEKHYEGEIIEGKITKIVDFGAFMEIDKGVEGLIHISQLSHRHVKTPDEVVTVNEETEAKIINIDKEQKRVGLSIKELEEKSSPKVEKKVTSTKKSADKEDEAESGVTIRDLVGDIFEEDE